MLRNFLNSVLTFRLEQLYLIYVNVLLLAVSQECVRSDKCSDGTAHSGAEERACRRDWVQMSVQHQVSAAPSGVSAETETRELG